MNIGRYEIQAELGKGGMATVYHAYDPRFRREVAVKVLPRELLDKSQFRARFEREAQTIATLEHPTIVPVYDFGEEDGQLYLVMRLMSGGSLADYLRERAPLPVEEAIQIVERLAPALDAAHNRGIIHRDLKPGNILFDQYRNACLSDFGIVKLAEETSSLTGAGGSIGTPAYMSPEQVKAGKPIDGRSDIYALGIILYEMLVGRVPYHAETPMRLAMKHINEPVPQLAIGRPDLPAALNNVVAKALAKDPADRFRNATEMVAALRNIPLSGDTNYRERTVAMDSPGTLESNLPPAASTRAPAANPQAAWDQGALTYDPAVAPMPVPTQGARPPQQKPKPSLPLPIIIGGGIVALIVIGSVAALLLSSQFRRAASPSPSATPADGQVVFPQSTTVGESVPTATTATVNSTSEAPTTEVTETPAANRITAANAGQLAPIRTLDLGEFILDIDPQPNGSLIGLGLQNRSVETTVLINPATGEEVRRFAGGGAYLVWSHDGAQLGTSTTAGQVTLWNATTFEPLRAFTPGGHFGSWSFDNSKFAFDAETGGAVKIWDAATNTEIENLSGLYPQAVVWSPTQDLLVIAGQGFYLWDAASGLQLQENAINAPAGSADWSPDGKRIAIGLSNGFMVIWDMTIGARLFLLDAGDDHVLSVEWSPDGTLIASTTYDGFISIWDAQTGNLLKQFTGYDLAWSVGWSSDMQWLATGSGSNSGVLTLWGIGP